MRFFYVICNGYIIVNSKKTGISHERYEADYRLRRLDLWSIGAISEQFRVKFWRSNSLLTIGIFSQGNVATTCNYQCTTEKRNGIWLNIENEII